MPRNCPESAARWHLPSRIPSSPLKNTLPWDRPLWGSSDPKENKGKSGPHSLPGYSYASNHYMYSPGLVPLLPVLPMTVPASSQLPARTHSGQGPPPAPQVLPIALAQRRALCSAPLLHRIVTGPSQGYLRDKNPLVPLLPHPCQIHGGDTALWDWHPQSHPAAMGDGFPASSPCRWGPTLCGHSCHCRARPPSKFPVVPKPGVERPQGGMGLAALNPKILCSSRKAPPRQQQVGRGERGSLCPPASPHHS